MGLIIWDSEGPPARDITNPDILAFSPETITKINNIFALTQGEILDTVAFSNNRLTASYEREISFGENQHGIIEIRTVYNAGSLTDGSPCPGLEGLIDGEITWRTYDCPEFESAEFKKDPRGLLAYVYRRITDYGQLVYGANFSGYRHGYNNDSPSIVNDVSDFIDIAHRELGLG